MSAAVLFGRRWYFDASDAFLPHLCSTLFSLPLFIAVLSFFLSKRNDLPCGTELDLLFIITSGLLFVSLVADVAVMIGAFDVRIFAQSKLVTFCIYFKFALAWVDVVRMSAQRSTCFSSSVACDSLRSGGTDCTAQVLKPRWQLASLVLSTCLH